MEQKSLWRRFVTFWNEEVFYPAYSSFNSRPPESSEDYWKAFTWFVALLFVATSLLGPFASGKVLAYILVGMFVYGEASALGAPLPGPTSGNNSTYSEYIWFYVQPKYFGFLPGQAVRLFWALILASLAEIYVMRGIGVALGLWLGVHFVNKGRE